MREIKFRYIIGTNNKTFSRVFEMDKIREGVVDNWMNEVYLREHKQNTSQRWDSFIESQYTGLKDKNGKEIYEGDILKFIPDNTWGEVKVFNKSLCLGIEWENSKTSFFTQLFYLECEKELEVIGNIHENQELIGKD